MQKAVIRKRVVPATKHLPTEVMRALQVKVKEVQRGTQQVLDKQQAHLRVFQLLVHLSFVREPFSLILIFDFSILYAQQEKNIKINRD